MGEEGKTPRTEMVIHELEVQYNRACNKSFRQIMRDAINFIKQWQAITNTDVNRVACAALRHRETGHIIAMPRHFGVYASDRIKDRGDPFGSWAGAEQGFLDKFGKFITREEAWEIADKAGQIIRDRDWCTGELHSEHIL